MSYKERKFKPEYAIELHHIAKSDLSAAELLHATGKARAETIVFHVQQAIEKTLKAVICFSGRPIPLVHDIGILVGKIDPSNPPPHGFDLTDFNDYAGIRRYEEAKMELSTEDILTAIAIGQSVVSWAEQIFTQKQKVNV